MHNVEATFYWAGSAPCPVKRNLHVGAYHSFQTFTLRCRGSGISRSPPAYLAPQSPTTLRSWGWRIMAMGWCPWLRRWWHAISSLRLHRPSPQPCPKSFAESPYPLWTRLIWQQVRLSACLHTMAILQAYQADLLRHMGEGQRVGPDGIKELCRATDQGGGSWHWLLYVSTGGYGDTFG